MKKEQQLGMSPSTAAGRLRKTLLFNLVVRLGLDVCFRCNRKIEKEAELTIDHKTPWLDSGRPVELFFSLENIAFSHHSCNVGLSRKAHKKYFTVEERKTAFREIDRQSHRRHYSPEKRREKYKRKGY